MKNLKIKLGLFSLLAIFATSVFLTSCEQEEIFQGETLNSEGNNTQLASIEFDTDITVDYLSKFTDIVDIEFVQHKYKLGKETYAGICNVSGKKKTSEILNTLQKEFEIFLKDIENQQSSEDMKNTSGNEVEIPAKINFKDEQHYKISNIQVKGTEEALTKIENFDKVSNVIRNINADRDATKSHSKSGGCWAPDSGYIRFRQSSVPNNRYVYSRFRWSCLDDIESDWTYEHDVWLNNYNNNSGTYLSQTIKYASSSMPQNLYLDTNFGNGSGEVGFSIGTSRMENLETNTYYFTYIRTTEGSVSSDKFKLQPQQGHRTPNWCHSTWCIYGDQSTQLIPAWNNNVPGTTWF